MFQEPETDVIEAAYGNERTQGEQADPELTTEKTKEQEVVTENERNMSFIAMGAMFVGAYLMLVWRRMDEEHVAELLADSTEPVGAKHGKREGEVEVFTSEDTYKARTSRTAEQRENDLASMAVFGLLMIAFYSLT